MKESMSFWVKCGAAGLVAMAVFGYFFAHVRNYPEWAVQAASLLLATVGGALSILVQSLSSARKEERVERQVEAIQTKAEAEPEKVRFAWDLARVKLEAYFDRNLSQVNAIFYVSVAVMIAGFGLVGYGVLLSMSHPQATAAYVSAISGIITQFIGATFMLIYRSTMAQANSFMTILERINTVGMAVQILDSMPESEGQLKNETRSEIVKLLLAANKDSFRPDANQRGTAKRQK